MNNSATAVPVTTVITPEELLKHWQGHRGLTRRVIDAFPEDALFNYSIGGMRPFAEMVMELLAIAEPGLDEMANGTKREYDHSLSYQSKAALLERWDDTTAGINALFPKLKAEQFHDHIKSFGLFEGSIIGNLLYFIDNEIHHRGQAYVYLRSLSIEPPAFWEH
ncbi:MAG TPA: DinB family protein [Edaphocola sp.]|nr:DinB family protein [Edaphocola sp.]